MQNTAEYSISKSDQIFPSIDLTTKADLIKRIHDNTGYAKIDEHNREKLGELKTKLSTFKCEHKKSTKILQFKDGTLIEQFNGANMYGLNRNPLTGITPTETEFLNAVDRRLKYKYKCSPALFDSSIDELTTHITKLNLQINTTQKELFDLIDMICKQKMDFDRKFKMKIVTWLWAKYEIATSLRRNLVPLGKYQTIVDRLSTFFANGRPIEELGDAFCDLYERAKVRSNTQKISYIRV